MKITPAGLTYCLHYKLKNVLQFAVFYSKLASLFVINKNANIAKDKRCIPWD
jgi:hypothetical protein